MDVSPAYVNTSKQVIPFAEEIIVHDPFHVMKLANEDLDKVCKQEHRRLLDQVGNTLSRSKYLWLTGMENHTESQTARFESICTLKLETGRVWSYKELFRGLWKQPDSRTARSFFQECNRSVIPTKLEPRKKLARTIKLRIANIVTFCTHGITNGAAEGINSMIMSINRRAGESRNRKNSRKAIFFYCGSRDLYPR